VNTWQQHACAGPWYGGKALTDNEIICIGRTRIAYVDVDPDELAFIDPYVDARAAQTDDDDPADRVPDPDSAIREELELRLLEMFRVHRALWATTGSGVSFQWVAGGVSTDGADLNEAVTSIRAFALVSLWSMPVSTTEVDNARKQIASRTKGAHRG
jgi:hypothetical protein